MSNPKKSYKYANFRLGRTLAPTALLNDTNNIEHNKDKVLEMFSDYFASVFTESGKSPQLLNINSSLNDDMDIFNYITEHVVCEILTKLKLNKSPT